MTSPEPPQTPFPAPQTPFNPIAAVKDAETRLCELLSGQTDIKPEDHQIILNLRQAIHTLEQRP